MYQESFNDKIQKYAALTALKLPLPIMRLLAGAPIQIDGQTLDPVVQFMVKFFVKKTLPENLIASKLRHDFAVQGSWFAHPPADGVRVEQLSFAHDNTQIPCEIHRPQNDSAALPCLIFYHGGGYAAGNLQSHRPVCRQFAKDAHAVVIAVDYRLAPEHPFPTPINDCLAAFDYISQHADQLNIDPNRIAVGGDSAGGNAAAVVAQQRRHATVKPKLQMLWVPWVDLSAQSPSYTLMAEGFFLDKLTMEWYTAQYLQNPEDAQNPLASPLLQTDFSDLCPALILGAGFDPLRDEGRAYAQKLQAANVKVDYQLVTGAVHPMINVAGKVPLAARVFDTAVGFFKNHI